MATETLEATAETAGLYNYSPSGGTYSEARDASVANYKYGPHTTTIYVAQRYQTGPPIYYTVWRVFLPFDSTSLPANAIVLSATLKLYGHGDYSDDEFDVVIVEGPDIGEGSLDFDDYDEFGTTSFGSLNTTALAVGAWNTFTINATGVAFINVAIQSGNIFFALRSGEDLNNTAPPADTQQTFNFYGNNSAYSPQLVLTISSWPDDVYPDAVVFPLEGRIDLATYSIIRNYLTGIDGDLSITTDGDGNVDLAIDAYITWDGTSEILGYDNTNSRVTVTTLDSTSALTIANDLVTADPSITTAGTAVDCTVANIAQLSDTAYASLVAKIEDDDMVFSVATLQTTNDHQCVIYLFSDGDLTWKSRDNSEAGVKTGILADFSAM